MNEVFTKLHVKTVEKKDDLKKNSFYRAHRVIVHHSVMNIQNGLNGKFVCFKS